MRNVENLQRLRREWYHRNREEEAEKQRLRKQVRHRAVQEFLWKIKEETPCSDCGRNYPPYVMDFDHLRDKKFTIARHNGSKSLETVKAEIAKCEVVCSNCHRIRTHNNRNVV